MLKALFQNLLIKNLFIETIAKVTKSVNISKKLAIQEQLLNQYKLAVDKTTLVSKTDTKGVITYVNDAFVEISGYDRDELIGSNHNIVRHSDMPKDIFKNMWETIKKGENWNGTIKNQRKDKSFYIVDANIFPLKDINGDTYEYLAIQARYYSPRELQRYFRETIRCKVFKV